MEREEVIEKVIAVIRDVMEHRFAGFLQPARCAGIQFPHPHAGEGTCQHGDHW